MKRRKTQKIKRISTKRRKTQRGKGRWRSGADTCVFKPAIKCKGDSKRPDDTYISRIVSVDSSDPYNEDILRTKFPLLHQYKLISISDKVCVPEYLPGDEIPEKDYTETGYGCSEMQIDYTNRTTYQVNLLTRKMLGSVSQYIKDMKIKDNLPAKLKILENALFASIMLVPDQGPWVVHMDLHFGNILVFQSVSNTNFEVQLSDKTRLTRTYAANGIYSSISDWGRVIYVENPQSVAKGVFNWGSIYGYNDPRSIKKLGDGRFMQLHPHVMEYLAYGFDNARRTGKVSESVVKVIRGAMPHAIINQMMQSSPGQYILSPEKLNTINPEFAKILKCSSQRELLEQVNKVIDLCLRASA